MQKLRFFAIICASFLLIFGYACNKGSDESKATEARILEKDQGEETEEGYEEHATEGEVGEHEGEGEHKGEGEEHGEEGEVEEAVPRIAKDGTYNEIRKGSRLILYFDKESSAFIGTVENLTEKTLTRVRIEVHLSNGAELGPTEPIDLEPGKKADVIISAEGQIFEWWKAHAELG